MQDIDSRSKTRLDPPLSYGSTLPNLENLPSLAEELIDSIEAAFESFRKVLTELAAS